MDEIKKILFDVNYTTSKSQQTNDDKQDFTKLSEALSGKNQLIGNDTIQIYSYKLNGKRITTTNQNEKIAGKIFNQIQGLSLKKNTLKTLQQINEQNILDVINEYNKISPDETLADAILSEWGLGSEALRTYIAEPLAKYAGNKGLTETALPENTLDIKELKTYINSTVKKLNSANTEEVHYQHASATGNTNKSNNQEKIPESIDPNEYTLEGLKKKYPSDKYIVEEDPYYGLTVKEKNSNKLILKVYIAGRAEGYGTYITEYDEEGKEKLFRGYNAKGELQFYDKNGERHYVLVDKLYDDIYAKTKWGLPTTGKDIDKHIKQINTENILTILREYADKSGGESLIQAIMSELGLSAEKRAELVTHVTDVLLEYAQAKGIYTDDIADRIRQNIGYEKRKIGPMNADNIEKDIERLLDRISTSDADEDINSTAPNGRIDGDFKQGITGDCWLLAAIKAITNNPQALEMLNSLITQDANGNIIVELKGAGKTYIITREELYGCTELSTGDLDIRAIEIAVNRYLHEEYEHSWNPHRRNDIDKGGQAQLAFQILFNKGGDNFLRESGWGSIYEALFSVNNSLIEKIKNHKAIVVAGVTPLNFSELKKATDENGNNVKIERNHAYSIIDADEQYVYLANPWDTSQVIKMTHEDFKATFNSVDVLELE